MDKPDKALFIADIPMIVLWYALGAFANALYRFRHRVIKLNTRYWRDYIKPKYGRRGMDLHHKQYPETFWEVPANLVCVTRWQHKAIHRKARAHS